MQSIRIFHPSGNFFEPRLFVVLLKTETINLISLRFVTDFNVVVDHHIYEIEHHLSIKLFDK